MKTTVRYDLILIRMAIIKNTRNKCQWGYEINGILCTIVMENILDFSQNNKNRCDPETSLLEI